MKSFYRTQIIAALGVLSAGLAAADFTLVRDHQAQSAILLPADAPKQTAEAAERFNRTLKTITGARLPVITKDAPGKRITFLIRKMDSLKTADNFIIDFPDERTMQIEGTEYSVEWALNHIIREFAKAEWLFPETCGLSYKPLKDLIIPAKKIEVKNISWMLSRFQNTTAAFPILNFREGLLIEHAMTLYPFPRKKYGKDNSWPKAIMPVLNGKKITALPNPKHPEAYWQPCYSNPETTKIAVENILEYLKNKPGTLALSLGSNDNAGFCECKECLKLDSKNTGRSESYFTFINRVMNEVCRKYPKLMVSVFAYDQTYLPPSFKLHPNVVPFLTIDFNSCVSPKIHEKHKRIIDEWGKKASHLGVWDYSWGYPYPVPRMFAPYHLDMLKYMFERNGCAYRGECWTVDCHEGPKLYLISKLLWNSKQDMKKLEEEWYLRCVGKKAAPYLKAYYKVWNDYYTGERVKQTAWFQSAPATYMTYCDYTNIYGLRESDIQAADAAMKRVVELAGTAQEKERAELLMLHWRYALLRLRMLGTGIYDPKGTIRTPDEALRLLDTVEKFSAYQKEYRKISEIVSRDPLLRRYYLRSWYRASGSPVGVEEKLSDRVIMHIVEASKFAGDAKMSLRMKQIASDPRQTASVRQLCKTLSKGLKSLKNLLPDGNAEQGLTPAFSIREEDRKDGSLSVTEEFKSEGRKSFQVSIKGPYTLFWILAKAKPSTVYMVTFKAFVPKTSAEGYLQTMLLSEKNGKNQQWYNSNQLKLAGDVWSSFSVMGTTRPDSDSIRWRIYLRNYEKGARVCFDEIRLVELGPVPAAKATSQKGNGKNFFTLNRPADFLQSQAVSQKNGVLQIKGGGEFTSAKTLVLDPAKKYRLSGQFRRKTGSPVQVLFGYIPLDAQGKTIYPWYILTRDGTGTEVAEEAKRGEKVLRIKDASQWKAGTTHGFVAFDVKDDYSDLPNRSVVPMLKNGIEKAGDSWKIALRSALPKNIPTGTKVRQHLNGATYIWNGGVAKLNDKWTTKSGILSGQVKHGNAQNKLWPGTKSVRVLIRLNGKADSVTEIRNVKVEEIQ